MEKLNNLPKMGAILCKDCGEEIEAIAAPKVVTYYADGSHCNCQIGQEQSVSEE